MSRTHSHRGGRRRRLPAALVLLGALVATGTVWAVAAPSSGAVEAQSRSMLIEEGRRLYLTGCSTCHGLQVEGTSVAHSLIGVGAGAVDFQVGTGRMPLAFPGPQSPRRRPVYTEEQILQLATYIDSLGGGPEIPIVDRAEIERADLQLGGELFRQNCAQCHSFAGEGGPLTQGKYAPQLHPANEKQIIEAMRTGPESMPVFGPDLLNDEQVNAIVRYVLFLRETQDPGGHSIGHLGPVSEGLVAWLAGLGALVLATLWIGARA